MRLAFSLCLGVKLGTGKQWMNWIHIHDIARLFVESVHNTSLNGTYNGVSPGNVTNSLFTKLLGKVLHRPTFFSVPSFILRLVLGEFSEDILNGQRVLSDLIEKTGFKFEFPHLELALKDILHRR